MSIRCLKTELVSMNFQFMNEWSVFFVLQLSRTGSVRMSDLKFDVVGTVAPPLLARSVYCRMNRVDVVASTVCIS